MSTVTINNSPFHSQATITRVYGYISSQYECGYHTGVDLVSSNRAIFPPFDGTITYLNTSGSGALGVQVQVIDGAREILAILSYASRLKYASLCRATSNDWDSNRYNGGNRSSIWRPFTFGMSFTKLMAMWKILQSL